MVPGRALPRLARIRGCWIVSGAFEMIPESAPDSAIHLETEVMTKPEEHLFEHQGCTFTVLNLH
jgi:hypothetical protein